MLSFFSKLFFVLLTVSAAQEVNSVKTIEDYNNQLPVWGTSWNPGSDSISGYFPSFYTGFAPRSEFPNRIHIRTSRGNQTRVSVVLDDQTVRDYGFDLAKRYNFYKEMIDSSNGKPIVNISPKGAQFLPQLNSFFEILESENYNVVPFVTAATVESVVSPVFYVESLNLIAKLNPGRVFVVDIDLNKEFNRWQNSLAKILNGSSPSAIFTLKAQETVYAINTLVWGRINYTNKPSDVIVQQLVKTAEAAMSSSNEIYYAEAIELFRLLAEDKYNFMTVNEQGQWISALSCNDNQCRLRYPEFTTVYPTGSVASFTNDRFDNKIPVFATPGLWPFLERSYHKVDHIRKESYYGWAPKMDFEDIGNGFHNPAVRFTGSDFSKDVKESLGAPADHTSLWAVKRGGVSHGCLRLPLGHVWEMRHIMPVESEKMIQVYQFGNNSQDFDLYDINGDGELEVIGVEYQISYDTKGSSNLDRREGEGLSIGTDDRTAFYNSLYGKKNVFSIINDEFIFINPQVSFPSHLDYQVKKTLTSVVVEGNYPLYEQIYERDKVQFYLPITKSGIDSGGEDGLAKKLIRLMGRVRGCAPNINKEFCGEKAFDDEKLEVIKKLKQ